MNETLLTPSHMGGELPTGVIIPFAGNIELDGWSVCDGGELSRVTYKNLFNVIGTTYGEGDGSTTFNKPNFIGKTIWGDTTAGIEKQAGLPNIEGTATPKDNGGLEVTFSTKTSTTGVFTITPKDSGKIFGTSSSTYPHGILNFDASMSNSIYGNSNTVQPPAITVRMIIKL